MMKNDHADNGASFAERGELANTIAAILAAGDDDCGIKEMRADGNERPLHMQQAETVIARAVWYDFPQIELCDMLFDRLAAVFHPEARARLGARLDTATRGCYFAIGPAAVEAGLDAVVADKAAEIICFVEALRDAQG
jgi:hypothetical protein